MNLFEEQILNNIFDSLLIVVLMWCIYVFITGFVRRIFTVSAKLKENKRSLTIMKLINNVFKYIIIVIAILMIMNEFGFDTKALVASLGVFGVVAGLALKDIVADFIVGISIVTDNQYEVGDFVTIGGFKGEVIELGLQSTKIKALNGDVKIVSNGTITEVINHSKNPNGILIDIPTSYNADTKKVEKVLNDICEDINKRVDYLTSEVTVLGIYRFDGSAIIYRLSGEVEPMKGYAFEREVNKTVKTFFDKNKLEIPFNQLVIHNEK